MKKPPRKSANVVDQRGDYVPVKSKKLTQEGWKTSTGEQASVKLQGTAQDRYQSPRPSQEQKDRTLLYSDDDRRGVQRGSQQFSNQLVASVANRQRKMRNAADAQPTKRNFQVVDDPQAVTRKSALRRRGGKTMRQGAK